MHINGITLKTHQLPILEKFYHKTLELPLRNKRKRSFTVGAGKTELTFSQADAGEEPIYHFAFNIPQNRLADAKAWLKGRAELIEKEGEDQFRFENWNAEAIFFRDPVGNIVEFIARRNLNNPSDKPFSSGSLICISELGVPVDDLRLFVTHIKGEMGIKLWRGDMKQFAAVGDEHGLLIVVPHSRPWFPTTTPAEYFDMEIHVE